MSVHEDAFHAKVEAERATRRRFFIKGEGEVFFSPACKEIMGKGAAVAVLIHVLFRQSFPPRAKERKKLERAGMWPPPPQEFSFPYREARHHGLTEKALAAGLAALHRVGFIDRVHPGSGKKRGDFARYIISERWRAWDRKDFKELPWEKATSVGLNDTGGTGRFLPRRKGKKGVHETFVAAKSAATEDQLTAKSAATTSPVAAKSAVNTPPPGVFVAAKSAVFLSSPSSDGDPKKIEEKVRTLNQRSKGAAAPSKTWRPPLYEIKENVTEILRQRPDPRANDQRFVRFLADQLLDAQRGKLNPARVHRDLRERHDLDDWTADLMFTIATIDLEFRGATQ